MELSKPVEIHVVQRRDNGSGVIEIPLLPATEIDLSKTASGGDGTTSITVEDLQAIADNFPKFPGPVPISVQPHREFGDRAGFSPGFINSVSVRGDVLFGQVDLIAPLFFEVEAGGWRGFSVEIAKNPKFATVELDGWVLTGGVFTNRPATDVNFRIAASAQGEAECSVSHSICLKGKEKDDMSEDKIASLEAELSTQRELVTSLRSQAESMSGTSKELEAKLSESKKDLSAANIALADAKARLSGLEEDCSALKKQLATEQQTRREAEIKLEAEQNRALRDDVKALAEKAIERGISAKHFEGCEEDSVAWFNKRFVSLEAMSQFIDALPTVKESAVSSGKKPEGEATLSAETVSRLRRMGIDPKYARITKESELLEMKAKEAENKK